MTAEQETTLRKELYQMLITGDYTKHDISQYRLWYYELDRIWNQMRSDEGYIAYQSHAKVILQTVKDANEKVVSVGLLDLDGGDFLGRYKRVLSSIAYIKSKITPSMSEVEKVLYIHEYIVQKTIYKNSGYISSMGGGPLGENYGVCEGYANAMLLLLKEVGIDAYFVTSISMNHSWVLVKVAGDWYHIDPTWADTLDQILESGINTNHRFFMKNSNEFASDSKKHYSWKIIGTDANLQSTSTKYSNWFGHKVVGVMRYENGLWYYVDPTTKAIVRSTITGDSFKVIIQNDGTKTLTINNLENGQLTYVENGSIKSLNVNEPNVPELPKYTPLDFLQITSGASSFDTGYFPTSNSFVVMKLELTIANKYQSILKAITTSSQRLEFRQESTKGVFVAYGWYNSKVYAPRVGEKFTIVQDVNKTYVNDQLVRTATKQSFQVNRSLVVYTTAIKFYRLTIKENDNIIHDFIPVRDKDGVSCLYNLVSEEFIYAK